MNNFSLFNPFAQGHYAPPYPGSHDPQFQQSGPASDSLAKGVIPPPPMFVFDLQGSRGEQPTLPSATKPQHTKHQEDTNSVQGVSNGNKKSKRKSKGIKRKQAKSLAMNRDNSAADPFASSTVATAAPTPAGSARGTGRDPIVPPSAESGGIPSPSPRYLSQAHEPPTRLSSPRCILVVMDLNGTLLYRPDRRRSHHFVQRPHAGPFMQYLIDTFSVAVWSSARPANVSMMCDVLLAPSHRARLSAVWGRDKFGLSAADYNQRVQCYKRLDIIWSDMAVQASHPLALVGGRWDQTNTVLVDDSFEKARTEPHNLLRIPEFFGDAEEAGDILPQIHDYLNELAWQADISRFIHANPFTLNPEYKLPGAEGP